MADEVRPLREVGPESVPIIAGWWVADAAGLAALAVSASDVSRAAYQQDTQTLWLLVAHSPPTWKAITGAEDLAADVAALESDVAATEAAIAANASAISANTSNISANTSSISALTTSLAAAQRGWAGKRTFTAADSAQLADAGKLLYSNVAAAHDFTLQPNSSVTFGALDVTPVPPPGKTLTSKGPGAMVSMTPDPANLNIWNVTGDLA